MTEAPPSKPPAGVTLQDIAGIKVHKSFQAAMAHVSDETVKHHKAVHAKLLKKAADRRDRGK